MFLLGWVGWVVVANGAEWVRLDQVMFDRRNFADGDSFHARHGPKTHIFRLYWVDTPEPKAMGLTERTNQQARYFRIRKGELYQVADEASAFVAEALRQPFTVWTRWEDAGGWSRQPRYYAVVRLANGECLAEALVRRGLARIHGQRANHPDGRTNERVVERLRKLEAEARAAGVGGWGFPR